MLRNCLLLAGAGQLLLAAGSLAIPRLLRWSEQLAKVRPLTRQVFWTYAGYCAAFQQEWQEHYGTPWQPHGHFPTARDIAPQPWA